MFVCCLGCIAFLWIVGLSPAQGQEPASFAQPVPGPKELEEVPQEPTLPPPNIESEGIVPSPPIASPLNTEGNAPLCPPPPADACLDPAFSDRVDVFTHRRYWPEMWGYAGLNVFAAGNKMAPNGQTYYPLGSAFADLNIGLLPEKRLYIYAHGVFWAQKPTAGVTDGNQGNFDFSKRQMDLTVGAAWRYCGPLELRAFAYSYNNLNRGFNLNVPEGYNDGVGVENRLYIFKSNAYDLPRLNFLSLGYMPTKEITGENGLFFTPGLFARAYLTYEFVPRKYYVYADTQLICQQFANPRLLYFDDGFAARPFDKFNGLEFRLGVNNTVDVQVDITRTLVYALFQVIF
jgi:hypothetical protein